MITSFQEADPKEYAPTSITQEEFDALPEKARKALTVMQCVADKETTAQAVRYLEWNARKLDCKEVYVVLCTAFQMGARVTYNQRKVVKYAKKMKKYE